MSVVLIFVRFLPSLELQDQKMHIFNFSRYCKIIFQVVELIYSPTNNAWESQLLHIWTQTGYYEF